MGVIYKMHYCCTHYVYDLIIYTDERGEPISSRETYREESVISCTRGTSSIMVLASLKEGYKKVRPQEVVYVRSTSTTCKKSRFFNRNNKKTTCKLGLGINIQRARIYLRPLGYFL